MDQYQKIVELQQRIILLEDQVRDLIHQKHLAIEDERRHIANDMHDEMNAAIIPIKHQAHSIISCLKNTSTSLDTNKIAASAQSINNLAGSFYNSIRGIINRLRPEVLDILGLSCALEDLIASANKSSNKTFFSLEIAGELKGLENGLDMAIYRLVQEALSNIIKHANASLGVVSVRSETTNKRVVIVISDNGVGIDNSKASDTTTGSGMGLKGMRERVFSFDGKFEIQPNEISGTKIYIEFPLKKTSSV